MLKLLAKLFGDKKSKDIKELRPYVDKVNAEYAKLRSISDEQLRGKTLALRTHIREELSGIVAEVEAKRKQAEATEDIATSEKLFDEADKLVKERNRRLEEILEQILPEAFAIVKETSRRLTENTELRVSATDWDHEISRRKSNVVISGGEAIWKNQWTAAGATITWNMVHYDVQLMGGVVLHKGKIAEMATGEGKTLVATLPVFLNALTGFGLHVVTVNDY